MSRSVNRVTLVGNVGADPDVRETGAGTRVAHVSLATNRTYRRHDEVHRRTDWHRLTFWGRTADTVERYVRKGNRLYVQGRIEYGSYEREGVSIPTVDIIVQELVMLDGRGSLEDGTEGTEREETDETEETEEAALV